MRRKTKISRKISTVSKKKGSVWCWHSRSVLTLNQTWQQEQDQDYSCRQCKDERTLLKYRYLATVKMDNSIPLHHHHHHHYRHHHHHQQQQQQHYHHHYYWAQATTTGTSARKAKQDSVKIGQTTTLHVHHAFLYISLPSLHDYDVKMPNFTSCGGHEHKTTTLFFFSWTSLPAFRI